MCHFHYGEIYMSSVMNTKSEKHEAIRDGLAAIEDSVNWLNEYEQWRNDEKISLTHYWK